MRINRAVSWPLTLAIALAGGLWIQCLVARQHLRHFRRRHASTLDVLGTIAFAALMAALIFLTLCL